MNETDIHENPTGIFQDASDDDSIAAVPTLPAGDVDPAAIIHSRI
jgi:hypothetical protein